MVSLEIKKYDLVFIFQTIFFLFFVILFERVASFIIPSEIISISDNTTKNRLTL